jgi:hypothetical protein
MQAMLALVGAIIAMAVAPLVSATPTPVSAVPSASATANATTSCIVANPGEPCMFNMYNESDAACSSDYVSTVCSHSFFFLPLKLTASQL